MKGQELIRLGIMVQEIEARRFRSNIARIKDGERERIRRKRMYNEIEAAKQGYRSRIQQEYYHCVSGSLK